MMSREQIALLVEKDKELMEKMNMMDDVAFASAITDAIKISTSPFQARELLFKLGFSEYLVFPPPPYMRLFSLRFKLTLQKIVKKLNIRVETIRITREEIKFPEIRQYYHKEGDKIDTKRD